jgi:hypothetical protein
MQETLGYQTPLNRSTTQNYARGREQTLFPAENSLQLLCYQ